MSFVEATECNVCGSDNISSVCHLPEFPIVLRPIPREISLDLEYKGIPRTIPLRIGICQNCGHMILLLKLTDQVLQKLYDSCYDTYFSQLELGFATTDTDLFLEVFRKNLGSKLPRKSRVLEVGCYDGYILHHLSKDGFEVYGCDPSQGAKTGQEKGIAITRAFFSPQLFPPNHFDIVINRNLIEHIAKPVEFMASLGEVTKDAGYIIMETPNGEYYLQHGLLDPFHPEHLSVFTQSSLAKCVRKAGLYIEKLFSDTRNLLVICRIKNNNTNRIRASDSQGLLKEAEKFKQRFKKYRYELEHLVQEIIAKRKTIAIWGAGSFGITIMSLFQSLSKNLAAIVDRDYRKHGLTFLNFDSIVRPPEYLIDHPVDYIIVCSQYSSEIIEDIRVKYSLSSTIVSLTPRIEIIK